MNTHNLSDKMEKLFKENRKSKLDVQIWGGKEKGDELHTFFKKWKFINMPFVIIETIKEITFTNNIDISNMDIGLIERIRIFGTAGDLDLRRNSTWFIWRYVGENSPPSNIKGHNFWEENPNIVFFVEEKEALLWGKYDHSKKLWHDDRVAKAKLAYPVNGTPERAKIHYKTLSEKGSISFVWFMEIKGDEENEQ